MSNEERIDIINIDVSNIMNVEQLHSKLKKHLEFPHFYGMNWNAFWDTITGLVELPKKLVFTGWNIMAKNFPEDAELMVTLLQELNEKYPSLGCKFEFK